MPILTNSRCETHGSLRERMGNHPPAAHLYTHTRMCGCLQSMADLQTALGGGSGQEPRQCWRLWVPTEAGVAEEGSQHKLNQTRSFYIPARR